MSSEYLDEELEAAAAKAALSRKSDKRWKQRLAALALAFALLSAITIYLAVNNGQLAAENASFGAQQQGEKKEIAREASRALCGQGDLQIYDQDLCAKWAEAAQEPTVTQPAAPLSGPSQADLVNAFRTYCDEGNCRGRDGQPPTPDDIAAAFAQFCADGRCVGPAGKDAVNGKDGVDGKSIGPTPDMVLAAVVDYCSTGLCVGPRGSDGGDGAPASPDAIFIAVQQFCANDACRGPAGADGSTGATGPAPAMIRIKDAAGRPQTCVPDPPGSADYSCTYDDGLGVTP